MVMTLKEARVLGYTDGDYKLQIGYTPVRYGKNDTMPVDTQVYMAGGRRKGELYYLRHNPKSSFYCYRVYLRKEAL